MNKILDETAKEAYEILVEYCKEHPDCKKCILSKNDECVLDDVWFFDHVKEQKK